MYSVLKKVHKNTVQYTVNMKECSAFNFFFFLLVFYPYFELRIALCFVLGLRGNVCKFNGKRTGNYLSCSTLTVFLWIFFFSYSVDQTPLCLCILFYYKAVRFISLHHKQNNNLTTVCFSHHTPGLLCQVWCHLAWLRSCQCESVAAVTPLLPSFPLSVFQSLSSSCLFCHCDVTWLILLKFLSASVFENSLLCLATGALSFSFSCWCAFMFFLPYLHEAPTSANKMLPHKMSEKREVKVSHFLSHSMFLDRLLFISQTLQTNMTYMASNSSQ